MTSVVAIILFGCAMLPLILAGSGKMKNKKLALVINIASVLAVCLGMLTVGISAETAETAAEAAVSGGATTGAGLGMMGAALATGLSCIGAGIAVASSASAAIGAISENPKAFGKALIFVALAEGVALYGMLISIQILNKF